MITSILSKSKLINFIIAFFITLLAFILANLKEVKQPIHISYVLSIVLLFFTSYISVLILNFIVTKNKLTQNNNYEVLLYSLFLLLIPMSLHDNNIIFSNFFVLLGFRRLISIQSEKNVNIKLFDSVFWFAIASLFYFWAILFFLLIILTLLIYANNKLRYWIIPFVALIAVFILALSFSIVRYDNFFEVFKSLPTVSFDFSTLNNMSFIIAVTILLSFGAWASFFYVSDIKNKNKAFRASFKIILFSVFVAFTIVILAPNKNGSEFLFLFSPLAIIITNYTEVAEENWFKDLFLGVLIITPFILLFV